MTDRKQTILVVDDDRAVRRLSERMLQSAGYQVLAAASASEAIAVAERLQCGVDLLLTDMRMPDVDGHELILVVRRICPHIRTMAFSGFVADDARERNYPILPKPFSKDQLLTAVNEVLDPEVLDPQC